MSCVLVFTLAACSSPSNEEKANKLIDQYMHENLYDYESYESIKTTVDTLYADVFFDSYAYEFAKQGRLSLSKCNEYGDQMESAQRSMDIWSDSYTSYGRSQWNKAHEEMTNYLQKGRAELIKTLTAMIDILDREEEINEKKSGKVEGWKVYHKFRCKTKGGNSDIGEYYFMIDKEMSKIKTVYDIDDDYLEIIDFISTSLKENKKDLEQQLEEIKSAQK